MSDSQPPDGGPSAPGSRPRRAVSWTVRALGEQDLQGWSDVVKPFAPAVSGASSRQAGGVEYYRWKLLEGPQGPATAFVADGPGGIVGTNGATPKPMWVLGQEVGGTELCDLYVRPQHQGEGMSTRLLREVTQASLDRGQQIVYSTPNHLALPVEQKIGYLLANKARVVSLIRPLVFAPVIARQVLQRWSGERPALSATVRLASAFAGPLAEGLYGARYRWRVRDPGGVVRVPAFPVDTTALWHRVRQHFDFAVDRTPELLNWRYLTHPDRDRYRIFAARSGGDGCLAYGVSKIEPGRELNTVHLADFVADPTRPEVFNDLVTAMLADGREAGAQLALTWVVAGSSQHRALVGLGFRWYADVPVVVFGSDSGQDVFRRAERWYFTLGDSDNI